MGFVRPPVTKLSDKFLGYCAVTPNRKFMRLFERADVKNILISYHYIRKDPQFTKEILEMVRERGGLFMTDSGAFSFLNDKNFDPHSFDWVEYLIEYTDWLEENKEFIFLTLTVPNVQGDELDSSIRKYNKSFERLIKRKEVSNIVKGYTRKLEVTYNSDKTSDSYDTYHPHFHVVLAVNKSYFTDTKQYINHDRWLNLWREATGDYSITQVDVRKAKINDYKEVYELAKYSAKDTDYLINREVFTVFYKALKGKQVLVFSGLFKDAHKMYLNGELNIYKKQDTIEYAYMLS